MGDYYPTPAYCDERITLYLAKSLHLGQRHLDEDEFLNFEAVPLTELVEDVMEGRITDGKTQVAVLKAARILGVILVESVVLTIYSFSPRRTSNNIFKNKQIIEYSE